MILKTVVIVISGIGTVVIAICQFKILCFAFRGGIVMAFLLADRVAAASTHTVINFAAAQICAGFITAACVVAGIVFSLA